MVNICVSLVVANIHHTSLDKNSRRRKKTLKYLKQFVVLSDHQLAIPELVNQCILTADWAVANHRKEGQRGEGRSD